ncbi:MAG: hypothetical protein K0M55_00400 [Rhizobium sp.]|nr:hypothetical protein [Rhizobium sp.]
MRGKYRLVSSLLSILALTALPASAADCDIWRTEVWDVEGGKALTAHICSPAAGTDREAMLCLQCGEEGAFALRFDDGGQGDPPDGNPEWSGRVVFSDGTTKIDVTMIYEAMDGVLYAPAAFSGPLTALLRAGSEITLAPDETAFKARRFTLRGSSAALGRLSPTCGAR